MAPIRFSVRTSFWNETWIFLLFIGALPFLFDFNLYLPSPLLTEEGNEERRHLFLPFVRGGQER